MTDGVPGGSSGASAASSATPAARLLDLTIGYIVSRCISAAAKLRISDRLVGGPRTVEELAKATGCHAPSLYRMLRALASYGIYSEVAPHQFALTEMGSCLRSDVPNSLRSWAEMNGGPIPGAFANLMYSLETGLPAFEKTYGVSHYEYLASHPEEASAFNSAMADYSHQIAAQVMAAYDFSGFNKIIDTGGGPGVLLTAILQQNRSSRGVLFDLPHIAERGRARVAEAGLLDRCEISGGDFFAGVPAGGDAYILSFILHNWNDERCVLLLRNIRKAMSPGGRVILIDMMIPPGDEPHFGKPSDMVMLVAMGGQERSAAEYASLFTQGGLRLTRVIPTAGTISIVEAAAA